MLEYNSISFSYKNFLFKEKNNIIKNLSINFNKGRIYILYAPNGYGKTTFAKIVSGFLIPDSGHVSFEGNKIDYLKFPYDKFSALLNFQRTFYWQLSVYENLEFYNIKDKNKIKELSNIINLDEKLLNRKFGELSTGNQLKSVMLKILINDSKVIVLDEPFTYIDSESLHKIKSYLKSIKEQKYIIITTNKPNELSDIGDFFINLKIWNNF
ncbi:MAG: ATP-binding cassette domain-containing protein [Elusimicrobiales bacterium]|nr:ATP-binding cassette domain-containing protein [Elusimicrobiales bacterium]